MMENQDDHHLKLDGNEIPKSMEIPTAASDGRDFQVAGKRSHEDVVDGHRAPGRDLFTLALGYSPRTRKPKKLASEPRPSPPQPPQPLLLLPQQEIYPRDEQTLGQHFTPFPLQLSSSHPIFAAEPQPFNSPPPPLRARAVAGPSRAPRGRRNPAQAAPREGKSETVPPPFPWATDRRAMVHTLDYLLANEITTVTGEVQCKKCEKQFELGYKLREKFIEVGTFIAKNRSSMHDRAPSVWMNPVLPQCRFCRQENCAKPVISEEKKSINWLFLLLGQLLGCCTLEQLKYFCKHTKNHRTGAKDRVLYLTYLGLCKQLNPDGPFDR